MYKFDIKEKKYSQSHLNRDSSHKSIALPHSFQSKYLIFLTPSLFLRPLPHNLLPRKSVSQLTLMARREKL
ncbi:hypothetical protein RJ641_007462 [Dillenia turbinata]|uniref:Uncharacterized protein n=1 Tax=Dillenia turbinata TaxID=194707 RepID=A0AAN8Z9T4_9MAGN